MSLDNVIDKQLVEITMHGLVEVAVGSRFIVNNPQKYSKKDYQRAENYLSMYNIALQEVADGREIFTPPIRERFELISKIGEAKAIHPTSPYNDLMRLFCLSSSFLGAAEDWWPIFAIGVFGYVFFTCSKNKLNKAYRASITAETEKIITASDDVWQLAFKQIYKITNGAI